MSDTLSQPIDALPVRYRLYSPVHRGLTALGGFTLAGKHPAIVLRNRLNKLAFASLLSRCPQLIVKVQASFLIKVPGGDQAAASILFDREYSPQEARMLVRLLDVCQSFIDVGANLGYFSLLALKTSCDRKPVTAIEPNPVLAALIGESMQLNGFRAGTVLQAAVGAHMGECELAVNAHASSLARIRATRHSWPENGNRVGLTTLDEVFCARYFEFPLVKIDVEGYETEVFRGASALLRAGSIIVSEVSSRSIRDLCTIAGRYNYRALTELGRPYDHGRIARTLIFAPSSHVARVFEAIGTADCVNRH